MAMAEKGGVRKEEIEEVMIAELPRLMAESPALRQQLIGIVAGAFVRKEELKQVLDAIRDLREDFNTRFDEHSRILEGHSKTIEELMKKMDEHEKRLESAIGGLGARWGIMSEESFRQGLKGILQDIGLKVERYLLLAQGQSRSRNDLG